MPCPPQNDPYRIREVFTMTPLHYEELTLTDLQALPRDKTIFLMAVSPIEVHGPHLPVGTDVYVALELLRRYVAEIEKKYPEYTIVVLPPLYAGANALPVPGSLSVPATVLEGLLYAYAKGLAKQGFRYLLLSDNHGGPGHQLGIEAAARKAWRKHKFYLINPFGAVFRKMVQHDPEFLKLTGLGPNRCGDDPDAHAGTNETSLMLVAKPDLIKPDYTKLPASLPPEPKGGAGLVKGLGQLLGSKRGTELGLDLVHLSNTLAWVSDPDMVPYMGDPKEASKEAGEAMLSAHVTVAMGLLDQALKGEEIKISPMLWKVRVLRSVAD